VRGGGRGRGASTAPRPRRRRAGAPRPPAPPPRRYVLTQFNSRELNSHLARAYPPALFAPRAGFVDVLACHQTAADASWYAGSADAVRRNLDSILRGAAGAPPPAHVVVASGHALSSLDYGALVAAHRASGADATLATQSVSEAVAPRRGLCRVDPASGGVLGFAEKPAGARLAALAHASAAATPDAPYEASMGVYVFTADALRALLGDGGAATPTGDLHHFGRDVVPAALAAGLDVRAVHVEGYWREVASLRDFYEASLELASARAPLALTDACMPPPGAGRVLPPTRMGDAALSECLVGEGCTVGAAASLVRVVLGANARVGDNTTLTDCVLLGADVYSATGGVGDGCTLAGVVLDRNAVVRAGSSLTNRAGVAECDLSAQCGVTVSDGIIVVPRGATVPAGTVF